MQPVSNSETSIHITLLKPLSRS